MESMLAHPCLQAGVMLPATIAGLVDAAQSQVGLRPPTRPGAQELGTQRPWNSILPSTYSVPHFDLGYGEGFCLEPHTKV